MALPPYPDRRSIWTDELLSELKKYYPNETAKAVAQRLKITAPTVQKKAQELGLQKSESFYCWKDEQVNLMLKMLSEKRRVNSIAKKLNKTTNAIYTKIYALGLSIKKIKSQKQPQAKQSTKAQ